MVVISQPPVPGLSPPLSMDIPRFGCQLPPLRIPGNGSLSKADGEPLPSFHSLGRVQTEQSPRPIPIKRESFLRDSSETDPSCPSSCDSPRLAKGYLRGTLPWQDWSFEKKIQEFLQVGPYRPEVKTSKGPKGKPEPDPEETFEARRKRETHSAAERTRRQLAKETENAIHRSLPDAVLEHVRGAANDPKPPNKQDILDGAGFALPFARDIIEHVPGLLQQISTLVEQQEKLLGTNEQQAREIQHLKQQHVSEHGALKRETHDLQDGQKHLPEHDAREATEHQYWSQELCGRPSQPSDSYWQPPTSPYHGLKRSSHSPPNVSGLQSPSKSVSPVMTGVDGFTLVNRPSSTPYEPLRKKRTLLEMDGTDFKDGPRRTHSFECYQ